MSTPERQQDEGEQVGYGSNANEDANAQSDPYASTGDVEDATVEEDEETSDDDEDVEELEVDEDGLPA